MEKEPLILRVASITKPETFLLNFGELAGNLQFLSIDIVKKCRLMLENSPELLAQWNRAVVEEILCSSISNKVNPDIINLFASVSPFQSTPKFPNPLYKMGNYNVEDAPEAGNQLKSLIDKDKAVVVIPLKTANPFPALAHIWLVETDKQLKEIDLQEKVGGWANLPLYQEIEDKIYKTFTIISTENKIDITGKSFNLALELLKKSICEKNEKAKNEIAFDWIITGDIENNKVIPVEIGNKVDISIKRNWLFPSENRIQLTQEFINNKNPKFARDISSAFAHITGEGIIESGEPEWPGNFDVVHSLASKAREPAIAAVLLANPKKVVLWHSNNESESIQPAKDIKFILNIFNIECELKNLPDNSIKEAQSIIRAEIKNENNILFSVTNGNLLMKLAAFTLSEYLPEMYLVYKEMYAPKFEFTGMFYDAAYPTTVKLTEQATQNRIKQLDENIKNINWNILFQKNVIKKNEKDIPLSKEELLKLILSEN